MGGWRDVNVWWRRGWGRREALSSRMTTLWTPLSLFLSTPPFLPLSPGPCALCAPPRELRGAKGGCTSEGGCISEEAKPPRLHSSIPGHDPPPPLCAPPPRELRRGPLPAIRAQMASATRSNGPPSESLHAIRVHRAPSERAARGPDAGGLGGGARRVRPSESTGSG